MSNNTGSRPETTTSNPQDSIAPRLPQRPRLSSTVITSHFDLARCALLDMARVGDSALRIFALVCLLMLSLPSFAACSIWDAAGTV